MLSDCHVGKASLKALAAEFLDVNLQLSISLFGKTYFGANFFDSS
jgi:hypothetical protein